jgi:hypothetical protein
LGEAEATTERTLRESQSLLIKCLGEFIRFATQRGYELTLGEAYIATPRKTRDGKVVDDGVHMRGSLHYLRLAIDLNLFVRGQYIQASDDPAWVELGLFWEALDPQCRWGGRFGDGNHLSLAYEGRA